MWLTFLDGVLPVGEVVGYQAVEVGGIEVAAEAVYLEHGTGGIRRHRVSLDAAAVRLALNQGAGIGGRRECSTERAASPPQERPCAGARDAGLAEGTTPGGGAGARRERGGGAAPLEADHADGEAGGDIGELAEGGPRGREVEGRCRSMVGGG